MVWCFDEHLEPLTQLSVKSVIDLLRLITVLSERSYINTNVVFNRKTEICTCKERVLIFCFVYMVDLNTEHIFRCVYLNIVL